MKRYNLQDGGVLLDFGKKIPMIQFPANMLQETDNDYFAICAKPAITTTKAGREIMRLQPGDSHHLRINWRDGDRSWNRWDDYVNDLKACSQTEDIFAFAVQTSRGGGCWVEMTIAPPVLKDSWRGLVDGRRIGPLEYGGRVKREKLTFQAPE